ncbi:NAD-dependent epimerase/dehydratase family protein [Paenibacillus typhae]|uniref:NAD-dependent epimerase/dehydratase family protein n=1 Tax=Paenibacillus typhae TaxID=1174501 RepID=UPI001C8E26FB|nr:NAD-dependent epimerase/dehydratase family protein [Paenibacillus typhae]MBY0013621.1 NAD-dependent epimerase/dehydratase family protein [Paenibacillus typhae]
MKKKILITGKGSYISINFKKWIQKWPDLYDVDELSVRGSEWEKCNFSKYDVILHTAAIVHQNNKRISKDTYYEVNCDLAVKVAKKAKLEKCKQFIFLSTMSVYGLEGEINKKIIIDENTECNPITYYGKSKLMAEGKLNQLSCDNFKVAVHRPPMVYGDGCKGNYQKLKKIIRIPFLPDLSNQRSMISIDNLCEFIRQTIDNQSAGLFFPQDEKYSSTKEILIELAKKEGVKIKFTTILNPLVKLASLCKINAVNKMYGNLIYAKSTFPLFQSNSNNNKNYEVTNIEKHNDYS